MKTLLALLVSGTLLLTFGCSGGSSSGSDAGAGGSLGTGGTAGTGAAGTTGTGAAAGAGGIAGRAGTGGVAGQTATGGQGGVSALGGTGGHGGVAAVGGAGGHGAGGAGGHGAGGSGGAEGGISCGKNVCTGNQYCCSESCGLCAPIGSLCIAIACTDGGVTSDASACAATPALDSSCAGSSATPHYYRCVLSTLPPPCVAQGIGDVTNTFCCP